MDSNDEKKQFQRPSGGSTRTPRVPKGPRKVQWPDEDVDVDSSRSVHMLDEHALNEENFQELTEALERHRRGTPFKKVHYYPPQTPPSLSNSTAPEEVFEGHSDSEEDDLESPTYNRSDFHEPSTVASSAVFSDSSASPTLEAPGQYISEYEEDGLPGTKDLRFFSHQKARRAVQANLTKGSRYLRSQSSPRDERMERPRKKNGDNEKDLEDNIGGTTMESKGILSTLLSLYQHPSSRGGSERSSYDNDSRRTPSIPSPQSSSGLLPHSPVYKRSRKPRKPNIPSLFGVSRPATARSAGGVFGPLIASAGNLAGMATPRLSQLQPNVKAPGYQLSRYTLEQKEGMPYPKRPPLVRKHSTIFSRSSSDIRNTNTPPPSPLHEFPTRSNNDGSRSNLFGGYVPSIRSGKSGRRSGYSTPRSGTPHGSDTEDPGYAASPHNVKRNKRKKVEVYITRHIARIIQREEFLMKLTRAMMMFGGPSHRLQSQIMSAARVLDVHLSLLYLPDTALISFDDETTGTSHIKLIKQTSSLDLGKLKDAFALYWKVIHDKLSVSDASVELDALMKKRPLYSWWQQVLIGGMCSSAICTISFGGSFIDAVVSFPFGALLVIIQTFGSRNILYTYVFEVTITTLFSFLSAALATTHIICYSAVTSSSVVLILPGFLVLTGALELMSRNIIAGSVRILFAVVYALFLGFGFSIGAEVFELITKKTVFGADDYMCTMSHGEAWYRRTPTKWWAFLTVPMFSFFLSMRNQAPWNRKEMLLLVAIASAGWTTNYFTARRYVGQSDIIAAVGAFAVGLISNIYARVFSGNAFVVMITGILFQVPSGLGSGGLLAYASEQASGSAESYISGFLTALKLVSVAIGLTIGLGLSLVVTYPIQSRKREAGIFSL